MKDAQKKRIVEFFNENQYLYYSSDKPKRQEWKDLCNELNSIRNDPYNPSEDFCSKDERSWVKVS